MTNVDCVALNDCFGACSPGDQTCAQACVQENPGGYDDYVAAVQCIFCDECPTSLRHRRRPHLPVT